MGEGIPVGAAAAWNLVSPPTAVRIMPDPAAFKKFLREYLISNLLPEETHLAGIVCGRWCTIGRSILQPQLEPWHLSLVPLYTPRPQHPPATSRLSSSPLQKARESRVKSQTPRALAHCAGLQPIPSRPLARRERREVVWHWK